MKAHTEMCSPLHSLIRDLSRACVPLRLTGCAGEEPTTRSLGPELGSMSAADWAAHRPLSLLLMLAAYPLCDCLLERHYFKSPTQHLEPSVQLILLIWFLYSMLANVITCSFFPQPVKGSNSFKCQTAYLSCRPTTCTRQFLDSI